MMRNTATLFAAAAFALFSAGCSSLVPFTAELRSGHRLTDAEVKDLQFYSSHEITLRREVQSQDRQVTPGHKLRLVSGRSVEEVVIPAKTPGVATRVSARMISVSFVAGTSLDFALGGPGISLGSAGDFLQPFAIAEGSFRPRPAAASALFGQTYAEPPGQPSRPVKIVGGDRAVDGLGGRGSFPAGELTGNYFLGVESGRLLFAGLEWEAVDETPKAHLLIDADKLEETEERRTVLPGVRLGD